MDFLDDPFQSPNEKCYHNLPIEMYQEILERSGFINQIRLTQVNKYLHINLKIYDFYNIEWKYMRLHTLNAAFNQSITDEGILHMKLHTLIAENNKKITDDGIKCMNLRILNASCNSKITDEGIKYMKLHTLNASYNPKITDEGIK